MMDNDEMTDYNADSNAATQTMGEDAGNNNAPQRRQRGQH
jgi:hypothetical protein